jgi:hypothetical protein
MIEQSTERALLTPFGVRRVEPYRREPVAPVRHPDIDVPAAPAGGHGVEVLLAVLFPHDRAVMAPRAARAAFTPALTDRSIRAPVG